MEAATKLPDELEPGAGRSSTTHSRLIAEVARLRAEVECLEGAIRTRDQRTAFVMHELRQPLSALVLAASALAQRNRGAERWELERLCAGGLRLDALVSDLNDASFLESGQFALEVASTDLVELINGALEHLVPRPFVSVEGEIPPIDVDRHRVEQILMNLLGNAQKYGSTGDPARIEVARRGEDVIVSVTNEGGGIAYDERTRVFEPYYRGRGRAPGTRGLGLGLYICRRLVEEHGGRIWTDGDASRTCVSFSLPLPDAGRRYSRTQRVRAERA